IAAAIERGHPVAHRDAAVLYNGLVRYEEASAAAQIAAADTFEPVTSMWALPELVEAAARIEDMPLATEALARLVGAAAPGGTDWARGIEARCRAQVGAGENAHRAAIAHLDRAGLKPDAARARLLFGEWLRREDRRGEARDQLRAAHAELSAIGMGAFAE